MYFLAINKQILVKICPYLSIFFILKIMWIGDFLLIKYWSLKPLLFQRNNRDMHQDIYWTRNSSYSSSLQKWSTIGYFRRPMILIMLSMQLNSGLKTDLLKTSWTWLKICAHVSHQPSNLNELKICQEKVSQNTSRQMKLVASGVHHYKQRLFHKILGSACYIFVFNTFFAMSFLKWISYNVKMKSICVILRKILSVQVGK